MAEVENNRIQMDFLEVCSFGDLEQAKAMLKNGKINKSFKHHGNGWTALHWAARRNHQEIVELLLQVGFDPKLPAKNGKTPLDLATNKAVKEILMQSINIETNQEDTPFSHEIHSYEKLDSLRNTRFLLVRTSVVDGRECFKRIALRGCDSIDVLKLTIERAMEKGKVLEVMALPDKVKIQVDEQIRDLTDCQKVEVVFSSDVMNQEEVANVINECPHPNEPTFHGRSVDDIISQSDINNCINVDDSFGRMKSLDSIFKEQPKVSTVSVTSDCSLTAQPSSSATDIIIPCKILAEEIIKLQVVTSQQNNDEINSDKSIQMLISAAEKDCKSSESESEVETESVMSPLVPEVDVNGKIISCVTESNYFAPVRAECGVTRKDISRKGKLQIALLIGCIIGFGGLTYMLCKK